MTLIDSKYNQMGRVSHILAIDAQSWTQEYRIFPYISMINISSTSAYSCYQALSALSSI
jgi:hypothetical protein